MLTQEKNVDASRPKLTASDKFFRMGGSTLGGIVVGGAIGSGVALIGTPVGAVVGGLLGLTVSAQDSLKSRTGHQ